MGNQGAFITITGKDMTPKFTSYNAVVRIFILKVLEKKTSYIFLYKLFSLFNKQLRFIYLFFY